MRLAAHLRRRGFAALAAAGLCALLIAPASAQFWPFGGGGRPPARVPQQQYNPFGGWFGGSGPEQKQAPADYSRAPAPLRKAAEAAASAEHKIVVLGDAMADWLASGLEDAYSEKPEFGVLRRHRTTSGLIRYDPRRDVEWSQVIRDIIAADRPKFLVMMIGLHDRQAIRERPPQTAPDKPRSPSDGADPADPDSPEGRARASAAAQNAELRKAEQKKAAAAEQKKDVNTGPMEFHTEQWQAAYIKRIDATIAAMRNAGVPVFWVGLPPQRDQRRSADAVFLNDLFRSRAERAGIVYVDIWDGFVDEQGRYALSGPDFEGQTRRLRSGDTIYFTKAGARKLAHYIEREITRSLVSRAMPIALPTPEIVPTGPAGRAGPRPLVGPVIPLTAPFGLGNELLGGGVTKPLPNDPTANRVLVRGEPVAAPTGRADNFAWPRGGEANVGAAAEPEAEPAAATAAAPPASAQPVAPTPKAASPAKAAPDAKAPPAPKSPRALANNPPGQPQQKAPPRRAPGNGAANPPRPPMPIMPQLAR
jgi:uncharacterized protein